jgi:hypothetical protein
MAALAFQRLKGVGVCGTSVEVKKAAAYCVRFEVREKLVGRGDGGMRVVANARSVSKRCTIAVGSFET